MAIFNSYVSHYRRVAFMESSTCCIRHTPGKVESFELLPAPTGAAKKRQGWDLLFGPRQRALQLGFIYRLDTMIHHNNYGYTMVYGTYNYCYIF